MVKFPKRVSALIFAVMLIITSTFCVFAESEKNLNDDASLFTSEEYSDLESRLEQASETTGWDIIIYTNENGVDSEDLKEYCNEFYMDNVYGKGENNSGVMLTIDMGSRGMNVLTKGDAKDYFTDDRVDSIIFDTRNYLSEDDFYNGALAFINDVEVYAGEGVPEYGEYENIDENESEGSKLFVVVIALAISLALASLSVVFVFLRYKHHGKAGTYDLKANSVTRITNREDIFLYKNVSVVEESDNSDNSSSSSSDSSCGGGSSDF